MCIIHTKKFLNVPITTCEIYEATAKIATYFSKAKTNNNHTKPLTPVSIAVCADVCNYGQKSTKKSYIMFY